WVDRTGRQLELFGDVKNYQEVELSPDGSQLAVRAIDPSGRSAQIWLYNLALKTTTPLTFGPGHKEAPVWSPDGRRIAFNVVGRRKDIYVKLATGTDPETPLLEAGDLCDWSPDGRYVLYSIVQPPNNFDLWAVPLTGERKPLPVTQTPFIEGEGRFSPDGRLIAYTSDATGRSEL